MKRTILVALLGGAMIAADSSALAVTFNVNPSASWQGFMNVSNLPADGGTYQFGSSWGPVDLTAVFSGSTLTLGPNTIGDPSTFWYIGGGGPGAVGNKIMDANFYVELPTGSVAGQSVTFTGTVASNSLVSPYTAVAFIKDFAADYSSNVPVTVPLTPGPFSITLNAINNPNRHVQYGFELIGPNVWITDVGPKGTVKVGTVPEPTSAALAAASLVALWAARGRGRGASTSRRTNSLA